MDIGKQAHVKKRFLHWADILIKMDMEPVVCISFRMEPGGLASLNVLSVDGMTREELISLFKECLANVDTVAPLIVRAPNSFK